MVACWVRSIADLIKLGDRSIGLQVITEAPCPYFVPPAIADGADIHSADPELCAQFIISRSVVPPGRSLTVLRDVYVLPNAAIVTAENNVIRESCFPYTGIWVAKFFEPWLSGSDVDLDAKLDDAELIDRPTVYIREHGEMGFFHWIHSVFPRIDVLKTHGLPNDMDVLCQAEARFQSEALELIGLDRRRVTPSPTRPQFFRELIFPSPLVHEGDFWLRPPSVAKFYKTLSLPKIDGFRRIYLSRQDANVRRITNEPDLIGELQERGFVNLELSRLSFPEQLAIFRNCEFVVGPHGAGLAHVISMRSGGRVLEILHPRRYWSTYRAIAARRGLHYGFVVGDDEPKEVSGDGFDYSINLDKLRRLMIRMGE